jgi:cytochrome c
MPRHLTLAAALLALLTAPAFAAGDVARGANSFKDDCSGCHTVVQGGPNRVGPNLWGIYGTTAAESRGTFRFSPPMQRSGLVWDEATLIRYMLAPRRVVPGTSMTFPGVDDAAEAADIAAYLATMR